LQRRAAFASLIGALLCLLTAGCGTSQPKRISAAELAEARAFPYFTVYWVGESFAGRPVTAADGVQAYKQKAGDSVYYGDCVSGNGLLGSAGCLLPLKVTTSIWALHSNVDLGPQSNAIIRGVPAAIFEDGRAIELYSGRLVIDLHSNTSARAYAAAQLLRPINAEGDDRAPLPPPVYCPILDGPRPPALHSLMQRLPGNPCQAFANALAQHEALTG
jgi:hypothetical protein